MRAALVLVLLGALAVPATASAAELWATVNVCDTARHPNEIGIRASMPGRPAGSARRLRFRVQYRDGDRWRYVKGADSGWRTLSRARGRAAESGWSFEFAPPEEAITLRGVVRYQWLRGGRTVRRALERTETGHRSATGADPEGYSAASCSIG